MIIRKVFCDEESIPCLYLRNKNSSRLLIYFHANAEDVGATRELLEYVYKYLNVSAVAVEYPGYGVYKAS